MHTQLHRFLRYLTPIPDDQLLAVDRLFQPLFLPKGNFFVEAGVVPHRLGFVVSGLLRLFYIDPDGNEYTKSFRPENGVIAAYSGLLLQQPSRLHIEALEDTQLLVAHYDAYKALTAQHPCWEIVGRKLAESLFIKKEERESQLLLDDAATRYQHFLHDYPGLEPRLKQYHIASYLGITPATLSRIRSQQIDKN
ncbi:MAG: Crp/Fnr family transcriptional regulator [Sphaerospermopsis sp. SIO1G2]|nr:Crp/Fnr family transcriptional regulator [Sphaerospermopsis sp. SIO1G2]